MQSSKLVSCNKKGQLNLGYKTPNTSLSVWVSSCCPQDSMKGSHLRQRCRVVPCPVCATAFPPLLYPGSKPQASLVRSLWDFINLDDPHLLFPVSHVSVS